ncbi:MAG: hypothetical protein JWM85_1708 [Acidimicrobiaceae bacterium]|nr:hypothetical protein [Acidimicrobiaceae bacterium]
MTADGEHGDQVGGNFGGEVGRPPARRAGLALFRRRYGGGPGHLLTMVAGLSLAGYVISILAGVGHPLEILLWVAGAIVAHDLVLFPLYTALDRLSHRLRPRSGRPPLVPLRNHVRAPLVISGILLLMSFPLVFGLSQRTYLRATGLSTSVYAGNFAVVAGSLFAGSALIYALRFVLARRNRPQFVADDREKGPDDAHQRAEG